MLTDTAIRNAKPREKPYKVSDSQGLYLLVNPRGSQVLTRARDLLDDLKGQDRAP